MPFPNGDPKPDEPGWTGYIAPENGGKGGGSASTEGLTPDEIAQGYYVVDGQKHVDKKVDARNVGTDASYFGRELGKTFDDIAGFLGNAPKHVDPNAPGGQLDVTQSGDDRDRIAPLLAQLQQQAATGGGAWEGTLAEATQKAGATAQALGQSQPGVGYGSALRNIGNAQGAVAQRAVGQGNILREQAKTDAQDQLTGVLGAQGDADANQAASEAQAKEGVSQLNATLSGAAKNQTKKDSMMGASMFGMSDGGHVPGKAKVFGDDERNDTVRAKLSPGEIVIPRSHAGSPEAAADFVRALQSRGTVHHFDEGGTVPGDGTGLAGPDPNSAETARAREAGIVSILLPHVGAGMNQTVQQAPSIENGGLLNTENYDSNRAATLANSDMLAQRAAGKGPSVAPQQMQNATDENIAAAMQARGSGGMAAGDMLQRTAAATQGSAGNAAGTAQNEQMAGGAAMAKSLASQRSRDLAIALSKQQAAFRRTQMNAGLGLEQQAAMRGLIGGAGQAAMGGATALDRSGNTLDEVEKSERYDESSEAADKAFDDEFWGGGEVVDTRGADFVAALKRRRA